jgi:hypothetical protein
MVMRQKRMIAPFKKFPQQSLADYPNSSRTIESYAAVGMLFGTI